MGFFTGRVTFLRFRVDGPAPKLFGTEHLEKLSQHAIGKQQAANKDGTEVGWIAGEDILDTGFDLAKNVVNDTLHFALRVDSQKLPADLYCLSDAASGDGLAEGARPDAKMAATRREGSNGSSRLSTRWNGRICGHQGDFLAPAMSAKEKMRETLEILGHRKEAA